MRWTGHPRYGGSRVDYSRDEERDARLDRLERVLAALGHQPEDFGL